MKTQTVNVFQCLLTRQQCWELLKYIFQNSFQGRNFRKCTDSVIVSTETLVCVHTVAVDQSFIAHATRYTQQCYSVYLVLMDNIEDPGNATIVTAEVTQFSRGELFVRTFTRPNDGVSNFSMHVALTVNSLLHIW